MKIQLKRSNVLEGGAAKEPTVAQMEYGELAVNYNKDDPAIFIKDSNNNIIRISGVGNISDDGLTNVPASTTPPANPEPGNLWFNSEEGRLYVYYQDVDSSQWVDASPDSWDASAMPDLSDPDNQTGTLDDRYVNITGDTMTGTLNIGDWSGSAAGVVTGPSGYLHVRKNGGTNAIAVWNGSGGTSTVGINPDGSATFARAIQSGGDPSNGATEGALMFGGSGFSAAYSNDSSLIWKGYKIGNDQPTSSIAVDGSATFAGTVTAESFITTGGGNPADGDLEISGDLIVDGTSQFKGKAGFNRTPSNQTWVGVDLPTPQGENKPDIGVYVRPADQADTTVYSALTAAYGGRARATILTDGTLRLGEIVDEPTHPEYASRIELNASDGSADFAGELTSPRINLKSSDGTTNVFATYINDFTTGIWNAQGDLRLGNLSGGGNINIKGSDGSAEFAGTVSSKRLNVTASTSILSGYNSSGNRLLFIDSEGTLQIGGDLASTAANNVPNISLNADGSAEFAAGAAVFKSTGELQINRTNAANTLLGFYLNGSNTGFIKADGSAEFGGELRVENNDTNYGIVLNKTGGLGKGIYITSASATENNDLITCQSGFGGAGVIDRFTVKADGSATFANTLSVTGGGISCQYGGLSIFAGNPFTKQIDLKTDGSANFAGRLAVNGAAGSYPLEVKDVIAATSDSTAILYAQGTRADLILRSTDSSNDQQRQVIRSVNDSLVFGTENSAVDTFTQKLTIDIDGNAEFVGKVTADGTELTYINLRLEPDNPANFTTTTDSEGVETTTYTGPTLDVKDRLSKADEALQTLKTAAAAAVDFAALKAAIATALADI